MTMTIGAARLIRKACRVGGLIGLTVVIGSCSVTDPKLVPPLKEGPPKEKISAKATYQSVYAPVDILFVIDDSGSMSTHQTNLSNNVNLFVNSFFSGVQLDYHIGVINTSVSENWSSYPNSDGKLRGQPNFINSSTPNGLTELQSRLIVGTSGSGTEKMFDPIEMALTEPRLSNENVGFYRPEAHLAVIFITDAEDQSRNSAQSLHKFLVALKAGRKDKVLSYAAYVPSTVVNCTRDDWSTPVRLEAFLKLAAGKSFSLCDPDFGQKLAGLGSDLVSRVLKTVRLNRAPLVNTIAVKFGTQTIPEDSKMGWTYDPSQVALIFGDGMDWSTQPAGAQLDISFVPVEFDEIEPKQAF